MDPRDPRDPEPIPIDFDPEVHGGDGDTHAEPDPTKMAGAERQQAFEEERTEGGRQTRNQDWLGGVVVLTIFLCLFGMFRAIMNGNFAVMVACSIVAVVVPVGAFVAFAAWRTASKDPNNKNKKEKI